MENAVTFLNINYTWPIHGFTIIKKVNRRVIFRRIGSEDCPKIKSPFDSTIIKLLFDNRWYPYLDTSRNCIV